MHGTEAGPISAEVRAMIASRLPDGDISMAAIARNLVMHPRTLGRRLQAEGKSFRDLLEDVRRSTAYRYLTESTVPIAEISAMLGYSEPSILSRNCQHWFGCSPRRLKLSARRAIRADRTSQEDNLTRRLRALERENRRLRQLVAGSA